VSEQRLAEAKAEVYDLMRQLEYMNEIHWPWGKHDEEEFYVVCGSAMLTFKEPFKETLMR